MQQYCSQSEGLSDSQCSLHKQIIWNFQTWFIFGIVQSHIKSTFPPHRLNTTENRAGPAEQVTHFIPLRVQRYAVHASCHTVSQPRAPQIKYRYDLCPLSQPSHPVFSCTGAVGQTQLQQ